MRGVRVMVAAALVAGTVGLSACGDDEDAASDAAASIQSQVSDVQGSVQDQVDSALSQAGDVQSQVQEQVDSALSQAESAAGDATSAADEATAEDTAAAGGGDAAAGKEVFNSAGCAGCHTLADAGATGAVGPNLDEEKPSADTVVQFVTNGAAPMPSFAGQLSEQDIANVAAYVSSVAGS